MATRARKPGPATTQSVQHAIVALDALTPHPRNYRRHGETQLARLGASLARCGQVRSIVVQDGSDGRYLLVAGHGLAEAARVNGYTELHADIIPPTWTDAQVTGYLIADNESSRAADDDLTQLAAMLEEQRATGEHLESLGYSDDELAALLDDLAQAQLSADDDECSDTDEADDDATDAPSVSLADRFIVPPFSVLDARQGYWQARKRAWLALGIQSELGRGEATTPGSTGDRRAGRLGGEYTGGHAWLNGGTQSNGLLGESEQARSHYRMGATPAPDGRGGLSDQLAPRGSEATASYKAQGRQTALQRTGDSRAVVYGTAGNVSTQSGTSIFDPVLCEVAYRWFCPPDGVILDPFAGGSVRGIVAARTGRAYHGIDLRTEQVAANEAQAREICADDAIAPRWYTGDSRDMDTVLPADVRADLVFTCPPYYDLEVYSDDTRDLSTASDYNAFLAAYEDILRLALSRLHPDRFACVVVGDIRDGKGFYRNFVSDTIAIMERHGARLYNEAILVTAVGSLPVRAARAFSAGRKLGKTHQNVLIFCKGDPKRATAACGEVDVTLPDDMTEEAAHATPDEVYA